MGGPEAGGAPGDGAVVSAPGAGPGGPLEALVLYASELSVSRYEEARDRLLSENASCKRALEKVLEELDAAASEVARAAEREARWEGEATSLRAELRAAGSG